MLKPETRLLRAISTTAEGSKGLSRVTDEIKRALTSDETRELTVSVADLTIEEILDDELLGKIPVLSWIVQAKKTYTSISDRLFLGKVAAFVVQISDGRAARNGKFGRELATNPKAAQRFSETMQFLLSRLDATQKAAVVGQLCRRLLAGAIELPQFRRLCHIVDTMFIDDLLEHGRALRSISNCSLDDYYRMLERYNGLAIVTPTGKCWNSTTREHEECFNANLTDDGIQLHEAVFCMLNTEG